MMNAIPRDIHVLRYFSSFISVSDGKIINITDPKLMFCPLARHLYKGFKTVDRSDYEAIKKEIKAAIEAKIRDFGYCTAKRVFSVNNSPIPYGASEMLMSALKKKIVDTAVIVCDGAGTVITKESEMVQGIGGRMNSLLLTSPVSAIMARLQTLGCHVIFENALINQVAGVEKAIGFGFKKIAVTVSGYDSDKLEAIRRLESSDIAITILSVCTTGISETMVEQIRKYADIVWSCASWEIRQKIGPVAILQISKQIPVFILTQRGIDFIAAYAEDDTPLQSLEKGKQYLISHEPGECKIRLGTIKSSLRQTDLPALSQEKFAIANT